MVGAMYKLDIDKFKTEQEQFIYGIEGALRIHLIKEALFGFFSNPVSRSYDAAPSSAFVRCILAITDKRILIIGKTAKGYVDENKVFSFDYEDIDLQFKKRLGGKIFAIKIGDKPIFNFFENELIFEVNHKYYDEAEKLNAILSEYKI